MRSGIIAVFALLAALMTACSEPASRIDAGRGTVLHFNVNGPKAAQTSSEPSRPPEALPEPAREPVVIYLVLPDAPTAPTAPNPEAARPAAQTPETDPSASEPSPGPTDPRSSAGSMHPVLAAITAAAMCAQDQSRDVEIDINGQRVRIPEHILRNGGQLRIADTIGGTVATGSETVAQETELGAPKADLDEIGAADGGFAKFSAKFAGGSKLGAAMIVAGVVIAILGMVFLMRGANRANCISAIIAGITLAGAGVVVRDYPWVLAIAAAFALGWAIIAFRNSEVGTKNTKALDAITPSVEGLVTHLTTLFTREPDLLRSNPAALAQRITDELKKLIESNAKKSETDVKGAAVVKSAVVKSEKRTNANARKPPK